MDQEEVALLVDREFMEKFEAPFHAMGEDGWDRPPFLALVGKIADADEDGPHFSAGQIGSDIVAMIADPIQFVATVGMALDHALHSDSLDELIDAFTPPGWPQGRPVPTVIGIAFVVEIYGTSGQDYTDGLTAMSQQERDQVRELYGRIPLDYVVKNPQESRAVYFIDKENYIYVLSRVRGSEETTYYEPEKPYTIPADHYSNKELFGNMGGTLEVALAIEERLLAKHDEEPTDGGDQ